MSTDESMTKYWGGPTLEALELDSKAPGEPVLDALTTSQRIVREMAGVPDALETLSTLVLGERPVPAPASRLPKELADPEMFELYQEPTTQEKKSKPEVAERDPQDAGTIAGTLSVIEAVGLDWTQSSGE